MVYVAEVVNLSVVTDSPDVTGPATTVTEAGFGHVGIGGRPPVTLQVKFTGPVKPLNGVTVTVEVAEPPAGFVIEGGVNDATAIV
jgi:hypothetical protein